MPLWRYVPNRFLTLAGNVLLGTKCRSSIRVSAYSRELLERLPLAANSDDFVFDIEVLAETVWFGYQIGEVSCPSRVRARCVVDQLSTQRPVRTRVSRHRYGVSAGRSGREFDRRVFFDPGRTDRIAGELTHGIDRSIDCRDWRSPVGKPDLTLDGRIEGPVWCDGR
jgi:hypothetical protein